jgi:fluoroquinolone transport system permease protein
MKNRLLVLTKGELQRLTKYNVTTISFVVAVVWFLLLYFIDDIDIFSSMLPFIVIVDATMLAVIFIGAIMFFEKTESTISTMLVTPVKSSELILSKAISNTIHTTLSTLLIIVVFYFVKDIQVVWYIVIPALIISVFFHSLLGFVFSFHTKDFTSLLVWVMLYSFVFIIPTALHFFNIFFKGDVWGYILLITPSQAALQLIEVGFGAEIGIKFFISLIVLVAGSILGYLFYVLPKFKEYAVKQSGV